jgi:hypothetical protein
MGLSLSSCFSAKPSGEARNPARDEKTLSNYVEGRENKTFFILAASGATKGVPRCYQLIDCVISRQQRATYLHYTKQ